MLGAFAAESVFQLDAHCHLHWAVPNLNDPSVALRTTSNKPSQQSPSLFSFSQNKTKTAGEASKQNTNPYSLIPNPSDATSVFINTVTPQEYETIAGIECDNIKVGLGLHPWYVEECDMKLFEELLPTTRFIGEIGLDFSKKFTQEQKELQVKCFKKICEDLATSSFVAQSAPQDDVGARLIPIISVHTFNTHGTTHKILKEAGVIDNCVVVYHWFGDGADELKQAIIDKCLFSVNERMLATKKGAALARLIPEEQILFESDMPKCKGDFWSVEDSRESIISAWQKWTKMVNATSK